MTYRATEAAAERAVATLKRAIEAAENSNQAGEDFVVAAAAGPALLEALERLANKADACDPKYEDYPGELQGLVNEAYALVAKARGQ